MQKPRPTFLPYDKSLTTRARANRQNPTPAESLFWQRLARAHQFAGHKFLRQKPIGHYIVDFYCAALHWVIEIDGDSHALQQDYDQQRSRFLADHGLQVIRYTNRDVLQNLEGVFDDLSQRLMQRREH